MSPEQRGVARAVGLQCYFLYHVKHTVTKTLTITGEINISSDWKPIYLDDIVKVIGNNCKFIYNDTNNIFILSSEIIYGRDIFTFYNNSSVDNLIFIKYYSNY